MNIILFESLDSINELSVNDNRFRHIKKILKLQVGDSFTCGVINGPKGEANIKSWTEDKITFSFTPQDYESKNLYPVTLLVSQVRPICMKRILREAVCLGVDKIIISGADLTEKSYMKANFYVNGEYKRVLIDGAMQAAQTGMSEVVFTKNIAQAIAFFDDNCNKLLLDNVIESDKLSNWCPKINKLRTVIAIGPERGFSNRERELLQNSGFEAKTLGTRVLRTETACSAGLAVLLGRLNLL